MDRLRRRLGAFVAIVTLTLTPAVRVACLALCAAPLDAPQAAGAPRPGNQPPTPAVAAVHAHHHAPAAGPQAAATTASARAMPDMRCDSERDRRCANRERLLTLPAARTAAADAVLEPPESRLAMMDGEARPHDARQLIRVAPPGPPRASMPLRI